MNVVFWLLVIFGGLALWVLLSAVFIPLGRIIYLKWNKLNDKLNKEYNEEKEKEE